MKTARPRSRQKEPLALFLACLQREIFGRHVVGSSAAGDIKCLPVGCTDQRLDEFSQVGGTAIRICELAMVVIEVSLGDFSHLLIWMESSAVVVGISRKSLPLAKSIDYFVLCILRQANRTGQAEGLVV